MPRGGRVTPLDSEILRALGRGDRLVEAPDLGERRGVRVEAAAHSLFRRSRASLGGEGDRPRPVPDRKVRIGRKDPSKDALGPGPIRPELDRAPEVKGALIRPTFEIIREPDIEMG